MSSKFWELIEVLIGSAVAFLLILTAGSLLMAYPLKWAWNYVMPRIFSFPQIGAFEAFCLCWTAGTLLKPSRTIKDIYGGK